MSQTSQPSFLAQTNPEIFTVKGRPGGCIPIKSFDAKPTGAGGKSSGIPMEDKVSREFRVQTVLDEKPSIIMEDDDKDLPNPLHDSIYMLSVALSTVVLLAAGAEVPEDNIPWTRKYFRCIKDEFEVIPPNIRGILNELKSKYPTDDDDPEPEKPKTIRTTTRVKVEMGEEDPKPQ